MKTTSSKAEKWEIPSEKDLKEVKEKQLDDSLKIILKMGKNKYDAVGKKIAEQYSPQELGIIIAQSLIGSSVNSFDIKLTGEKGTENLGNSKNKKRKSFSNNRKSNKNYQANKRNNKKTSRTKSSRRR